MRGSVPSVRRFKNIREEVPDNLTPEELAYAETLWIKSAQWQLVSQDFSTQQKQFNLFTDEKLIWRCGGQLSNMEAPFVTKHPILQPRNHPLTTLVVRDAHERIHHNGIKETLTETRRKFWIPKGRSLVRYLIHRCILCRKLEGAAFKSSTTTSACLPCEGRPILFIHWSGVRWTSDHP